METITVTLDTETTAYLHRMVATGEYSSTSDFLAELVAESRKKRRQAHIEKLLLEGLEGERIEMTDAVWDDMLRRIDERYPESATS